MRAIISRINKIPSKGERFFLVIQPSKEKIKNTTDVIPKASGISMGVCYICQVN
ncbi:MAG: hypothetical protein QXP77_03015 [Candidatus Aenigmatarchaeota archaeon]